MPTYDLVIIGGGISGAGVAQAAAAAGYTVLLLEKDDFGSQTSSSSSKLIHGGLRYLESGQIGLVRESLQQRRALLRLAPDLVKPIPFFIPVYKNSRRGRWTLMIGLSVYSILAGFERLARFRLVPKSQWSRLIGLKKNGLKAVFQYWDAQTDDNLLTKAVVRSAESLGVIALCPARFIGAEKDENNEYRVSYSYNGETKICHSRSIIDAAGPWVNGVAKNILPVFEMQAIDWVQGAHIIINQAAPRRVYYLESIFDNRVVFVMPWYGKTMIGTTETVVTDINKKVTPTDEEINYLLMIYQHYFPDNTTDIVSSFAGIRVLPHSGKSAFNRSRESQLWSPDDHPNLRVIYGGKLTTFRAVAKELVNWIQSRIGKRKPIADIDQLKIS